MVLQRGEPETFIWGIAEPNAPVSVSYCDTVSYGVSDYSGNFSINLGSLSVNNGSTMVIESPEKKTILKNVAAGDIWLISGQSNAEYSMNTMLSTHSGNTVQQAELQKLQSDINTASNPNVRYAKMGYEDIYAKTAGPVRDEYYRAPNTLGWSAITPDTVGDMGAASYYFADYLQKEIDVPVGIINVAKAGKSITEFIRNGAHTAGTKAIVYNEQIAPILKLRVKGMLWIQGEQDHAADKNSKGNYTRLLSSFINDLRGEKGFNNADMPFIYLQLQRFQRNLENTHYVTYEYMREQQRLFENTEENIHMAVSIDLNPNDWQAISHSMLNHPLGKDKIGERMALKALRYVYGYENIVASGPIYESFNIENDGTIVLNFNEESIGSGLCLKNSDKLEGFEVAGADKVFVDAQASISPDGKNVILTSNVENPKYIRYIYEMYPSKVTLFNNEGLPASPFATDDPSYEVHLIS